MSSEKKYFFLMACSIFALSACMPTSRISFPKVVEKGSSYGGINAELIRLPENYRTLYVEESEKIKLSVYPSVNFSYSYGLDYNNELQIQVLGSAFSTITLKKQVLTGKIPVTVSYGSTILFQKILTLKPNKIFQSFYSEMSTGYKYVYLSPKIIYNNILIWDERWSYGLTAGVTSQNLSTNTFWTPRNLYYCECSIFKMSNGYYISPMVGVMIPLNYKK
ncbi:MAG: 2-succinylbenzoate--CoA ligase [Bacteroidetes bacterium]|nr:2-succinylbenzoate--CoA ligase [Bacteroidota bacterium]